MNILKKIIKFFNWLFKPWTRYKKVETNSIHNLNVRYREYQKEGNLDKLKGLVHLVDFMNYIGINGKTEKIKNLILLEWEKNKKGN